MLNLWSDQTTNLGYVETQRSRQCAMVVCIPPQKHSTEWVLFVRVPSWRHNERATSFERSYVLLMLCCELNSPSSGVSLRQEWALSAVFAPQQCSTRTDCSQKLVHLFLSNLLTAPLTPSRLCLSINSLPSLYYPSIRDIPSSEHIAD